MEKIIRKEAQVDVIHLHVHSQYSLRDSIIKPGELVTRLKELGHDAVAITDHGTLIGAVSLYQTLTKAGIKYIHGIEFYVCDDVKVKDKDSRYYHLIALAKNETGRLNMNWLVSESERPENKYYKPRIDFNMLSSHGDGLLIMSACMAGEVSRALEVGDHDRAADIALKYRARFGDDYFLEIQAHDEPKQIALNEQIAAISRELNIPLVVTTDAHYTYRADQKYQNKYAFNGAYKEDGETYVDCYLQSEDEVRQRLRYLSAEAVDEAVTNTHVIAGRCNVEIPLSAPIMPTVETPPEYPNNKIWLEDLCRQGFRDKLNIDLDAHSVYDVAKPQQWTPEEIKTYIDRYEYEMDSLYRMGFIDYILLVYSYANVAKRRGIARGSGGGSLICYVTNITNIDPIEHGLYFERFIDVGALAQLEAGEITAKQLKIPDIDLDFSGESCDEVMRFLHDKYGEERVASIGKFGTNKTKGTIRDLCKVLDIDLDEADRIAKSFADYEMSEIDSMISGEIDTVAGAKDAISYVAKYPELFDYVRKLSGLPKSFGLHACGKVIATRELDYYMPSCYDKNGIRFLQGDMHDVEDLGLVKIDVLGLRTLDQEFDTLEMSGESPAFIDPKQDYGDDKVLDIFRTGDTVGIFQMASFGMRDTLKKMDVSGIDDLSIANALYRPGSMAYIDNFCRRRKGEEAVQYIHPDLEPILNYTYGIIVFQEQLIEIGRMAGVKNPDSIRRATAKKKPELLAKVKPELQTKLFERGWTEAQFNQLWEEMLDFARYSFNKCVTGDTMLLFEGYSLPVEDLYQWTTEGISLADHRARSVTEDGFIVPNVIQSISEAGIRQVYKLTATDGSSIECTLNHKFPTPSGEKKLADLSVGDELYAVRRVIEDCPDWLERYVVHVQSIRPTRTVMTYDVTMAGPNHNFITSTGLVVSNSHASAYAIIAYMTAKQKAYYPKEFFAGLCNSYIGESSFVKDDADEIMSDAFRHGVVMAPFSFRNDHRRCSVKDGRMLYAVPLIKDCGLDTADALYEMRSFKSERFWPVAMEAVNKGINKTVLRTLVKLGFFSEYGNSRLLLRVVDFLERMKFGAVKSVAKSKLDGDDILREIIMRHSSDVGKNGKILQKYAIIDPAAIMNDIEDTLRNIGMEDLELRLRLQTQQEYLGFIGIATGRDEDRRKLYVKEIFPAVRRRDGQQFGYNIKAVSVGGGKESVWTVFLRQYERNPISQGDVIYCDGYTKKGKYYNLDAWHTVLS